MKQTTSVLCALFSFLISTVSLAQQEPDDPEEANRPVEVRRGLETGGTREQRSKRAYERAIRKIEPSLVGDPAKLPLYVELFKREFVEDTRTFAINVTASRDESTGAITTSGWVEFEEHRKVLGDFLTHLGFKDVKNDVQLLPDAALGDSAYAIVGDEPVYVYDRTAKPRETFTEALPGDALFVLKELGDGTLLCHVADGYVGVVDASKVRRVTSSEFDDYLKKRTPTPGRDARVEVAIAAAEKLLGTKYVWGGRTPSGIDCSGLVNHAFRAAGVSMPRDADQQSLVGTLVATRWHRSSLQRGDVLFFLGRRGNISHTAIYLGDDKFIEAASPGVKVSPLNAIPEGRDRARGDTLCFAKRVFE